jgi:hypothetical protein
MGSSSCLKSSFCCDLNAKKPTKISTITERSHRDNRDKERGNCLCKRKKLREMHLGVFLQILSLWRQLLLL